MLLRSSGFPVFPGYDPLLRDLAAGEAARKPPDIPKVFLHRCPALFFPQQICSVCFYDLFIQNSFHYNFNLLHSYNIYIVSRFLFKS
jgi:hypothetical protein